MPSGIEGLDTILNGGFMRGGIYFILGRPGSGKTILSNQIAFRHIASGGRAVFVSLLSETHTRMFAHLSSLSFFDPEPIGDALYFVSGYGTAQKEGLKGLLALVQRAVRDNKATLLIIDGALNAEAFARSELAFKEFIHKLQTYADANGCTTLLLSSADNSIDNGDTVTAAPNVTVEGQTTVDGLVRLSNRLVGLRSVRELQVQKFRGSSFLEGTHALEITDDGVKVYPRLEATVVRQPDVHSSVKADRTRLAFGIGKLDEMLHGGMLSGSSTLLLGPPGSGKTLLGLAFLAEGARAKQQGLYFGLNEPPAFTIDAGDQIGLGLSGLVEQGLIQMLWKPDVEGSLDVLAHSLLRAVQKHQVQRLVIDGLDAFNDMNIHVERRPLFFTALMRELRVLGVTTISTIELDSFFGPAVEIPIEGISAMADNILFLRAVELRSGLQRVISVLKTRRSGHDGAIREFKISDQGLEMADKIVGAEAILTGVARPLLDTTG
ncbi:MAG TPA: ATPase domain-containing protein [Chloroflexia bacterium]|nr:ATPase domain-containing protein [Chloroflexia bacterium]